MANTARKTLPRRPSTTSQGTAETIQNTTGDDISLKANDTDGEVEMVTAIVPKDFTLTLDNGECTVYKTGVQEMPLDHAAHWFSRAQGVKVYDGKEE